MTIFRTVLTMKGRTMSAQDSISTGAVEWENKGYLHRSSQVH